MLFLSATCSIINVVFTRTLVNKTILGIEPKGDPIENIDVCGHRTKLELFVCEHFGRLFLLN